MIEQIIYEAMKIGEKEVEPKVVLVVESCKLHRGILIMKSELIRKLEEAFPENVQT